MLERLEQGRRATVFALLANGVLAVVKLLAGLLGNSYALIADAVESFADIISSVIVWSGLKLAQKPADANHPYGHGRAEPLAALAVSIILLGAAVGIALEAVREIVTPHHSPAPFTLVVLVLVVIVKEGMYRFLLAKGRQVGSTAMAADAWHHRGDGLTSLAAAVGIVIALIGGSGYESADDWAALAACVIILFNGQRLARTALAELMDTAPDPSVCAEIRRAVMAVEGARAVEKILIRKSGPLFYVDLHLEVDPDQTVRAAHKIAHDAKDAILHDVPQVADVLIHVEPYGGWST